MATTLHIKNMVCPRCIEAVQDILKKENIPIRAIDLGTVILENEVSPKLIDHLSILLKERGFELIKDKNLQTVDEIKSFIIHRIHHSGQLPEHYNFSEALSFKLKSDYRRLSSLFSPMEGITIEKYIILQKIEKIREFISYKELNFSEIAYHLGYSSVSHMSSQFKSITGMTPTQYAQLESKPRSPLDKTHSKD